MMNSQEKIEAANQTRQTAMTEAMSALIDLRDCLSAGGPSFRALEMTDRFTEKSQKLRAAISKEFLYASLLEDALNAETR